MFEEDFGERVLPFDGAAARAFAEIVASRRQAGRPISQLDAQIAAIARSRNATVATRNTVDFEGCGVAVDNPWRAGKKVARSEGTCSCHPNTVCSGCWLWSMW